MQRIKKPMASRCSETRGAIMVEAALILPLFFLFLFVVFDLARYMTIRGALMEGADEAVALAERIEDLDSTDAAAKNAAIAQVQNRALQLARSTRFLSNSYLDELVAQSKITVIPPASDAFETTPITVSVEAEMKPLIAYLPGMPQDMQRFPISIRARGYREPRRAQTMPIPVDCRGIPQGWPGYQRNACPCPANKYWDVATGKCLCKAPYGLDGDCRCQNDTKKIGTYRATATEYGYCICKTSSEIGCGTNMKVVENASGVCECVCEAGFVKRGDSCGCPDGQQIGTNGKCECTGTCMNGKKANGSMSCSCECPTGTITEGESCKCTDVNKRYDTATGTCICNMQDAVCENAPYVNMRLDIMSCGCVCDDSFVGNGVNSCGCAAGKEVINGKCTCSNAGTPCPGGGPRDASTCICACNNGYIADGNGSCICPATKQPTADGGACECKEPKTCINGTWDTANCRCTCASGMALEAGSDTNCVCSDTKKELVNGQCVCKAQSCANGAINTSTCACTCNTSFTEDPANAGNCACAANKVLENVGGTPTCTCPNVCEGRTKHVANCECTACRYAGQYYNAALRDCFNANCAAWIGTESFAGCVKNGDCAACDEE